MITLNPGNTHLFSNIFQITPTITPTVECKNANNHVIPTGNPFVDSVHSNLWHVIITAPVIPPMSANDISICTLIFTSTVGNNKYKYTQKFAVDYTEYTSSIITSKSIETRQIRVVNGAA